MCFSSCKKEEVEIIHENLIIEDNEAPPYKGVSTLQIQNYVTKIYIDLLGIEPSEMTLEAEVQFLKDNQIEESARKQVAEKLLITNAYHQRFLEMNSNNFIEGADSFRIAEEKQTFEFVRDFHLQNGDTLMAQIIQLKINEMQNLLLAKQQLKNNTITLNQYYSYFITNYFYDEINMGSENFVKATFEDLFYRFPTNAELEAGKKMVDGNPSQIFLNDGNSKGAYIRIVTTSNEFYEGLTKMIYDHLLSRKPTSAELGEGTIMIKNSGSIKELQLNIIKSKEYAGF